MFQTLIPFGSCQQPQDRHFQADPQGVLRAPAEVLLAKVSLLEPQLLHHHRGWRPACSPKTIHRGTKYAGLIALTDDSTASPPPKSPRDYRWSTAA
ncbi:hypothetical protein A7Q10_07595 [Methylacidiphilum caldifontis]|uniref:Uncharacterized protein n=1 Tax=Methylacidiphilum caldifontis TaxID=2795386 RepID=A0A4Y8PD44_9BACT|nr:hypothetical protein A7Q10_07595 [Methylacidiphilum caldifontis]